MKKVFVSGCYDIIHGGHIDFWTQAKALGDYLIVSIASDEVLLKHKKRKSSISIGHKKMIVEAISVVDEVVISEGEEEGLDFKDHFLRIKPDMLVVTSDDRYAEKKKELCQLIGAKYIVLYKNPTLGAEQISTSQIINFIKAPTEVPLRVDFAGGWLDVPKYSRCDGYIINCAISPLVSIHKWDYEIGGGMGGSAAYAILTGKDAVLSEIDMGVGWQDPAIISETGFCVWKSDIKPNLLIKLNPEFLKGKMALFWTGKSHNTKNISINNRDYNLIKIASKIALNSVSNYSVNYKELCKAVSVSYEAQLKEGMQTLPDIPCITKKYCGSGWGGYALYMFDQDRDKIINQYPELIPIEPYIRTF